MRAVSADEEEVRTRHKALACAQRSLPPTARQTAVPAPDPDCSKPWCCCREGASRSCLCPQHASHCCQRACLASSKFCVSASTIQPVTCVNAIEIKMLSAKNVIAQVCMFVRKRNNTFIAHPFSSAHINFENRSYDLRADSGLLSSINLRFCYKPGQPR